MNILTISDLNKLLMIVIPVVGLTIYFIYLKYKWSLLTKIFMIIFLCIAFVVSAFCYMILLGLGFKILVSFAILVILIIIGIGLYLGPKMITRPIREVQKTIKKVAAGDLTEYSHIKTKDETTKIEPRTTAK